MSSLLSSVGTPNTHSRPRVHVTCFVDWNSQLLLTRVDYKKHPVDAAHAAFRQVTRRIAKSLVSVDKGLNFLVHLRLYHGWRKGFEETANFKAIRKIIAETDFSTASDKPSVTYSGNVGFGDCLLSAYPQRMHPRLSIHLPNTLRNQGAHGHEEKMVDTALAADLVFSAYQDPDDWVLVVSEDDDLIPPLFTAETIINSAKAKALILSQRKRSHSMLLLDGLDAS